MGIYEERLNVYALLHLVYSLFLLNDSYFTVNLASFFFSFFEIKLFYIRDRVNRKYFYDLNQ